MCHLIVTCHMYLHGTIRWACVCVAKNCNYASCRYAWAWSPTLSSVRMPIKCSIPGRLLTERGHPSGTRDRLCRNWGASSSSCTTLLHQPFCTAMHIQGAWPHIYQWSHDRHVTVTSLLHQTCDCHVCMHVRQVTVTSCLTTGMCLHFASYDRAACCHMYACACTMRHMIELPVVTCMYVICTLCVSGYQQYVMILCMFAGHQGSGGKRSCGTWLSLSCPSLFASWLEKRSCVLHWNLSQLTLPS